MLYTYRKDEHDNITFDTLNEKQQLHFVKHEDSGHGWLAVPFDMLFKSGIINAISHYSYRSVSRGMVYLEEDCDMERFINYLLENNQQFSIETQHVNGQHWIRNCDSLK